MDNYTNKITKTKDKPYKVTLKVVLDAASAKGRIRDLTIKRKLFFKSLEDAKAVAEILEATVQEQLITAPASNGLHIVNLTGAQYKGENLPFSKTASFATDSYITHSVVVKAWDPDVGIGGDWVRVKSESQDGVISNVNVTTTTRESTSVTVSEGDD